MYAIKVQLEKRSEEEKLGVRARRGIRAKRVKLLNQKEGTSWPTHV